MAVCIYLDWILGGPVNVICIVHSSDRMIGPVPPCQQSCYRHAFKVSEKEKIIGTRPPWLGFSNPSLFDYSLFMKVGRKEFFNDFQPIHIPSSEDCNPIGC